MKNLVNRVQLIGNLGMDPVLMSVGKGNNLVKFTLATHEYYKRTDGERAKETTWHQVIAWGPLAERLAVQLHKGMEVAVAGKIRNRQYETKEGERRFVSEVVLDEYYRIGRTAGVAAEATAEVVEEPMPF